MPRRFALAIAAAAVLGGCASETGPTADPTGPATPSESAAAEDGPTEPADTAPTEPADDSPPPAPASEESCGDPATTMEFGETVTGEAAGGEPVYYCVAVPAGQASVVFELTDLTADLDLYVAYDTFEELGGGLALRISSNDGTDPESVTVAPSAYRGELIGFDSYADAAPAPTGSRSTGGRRRSP